MGLTTKEWLVHHDGHTLRVVNDWFGGARLEVDGVCRATNRDFFCVDATRPLLACALDGEGAGRRVEVFLVAWVTTKAMITVDGVPVGGDLAPMPAAPNAPGHYRTETVGHAGAEIGRLQRELSNARSALAVFAMVLGAGVVLALFSLGTAR